jgi:hypothetical protein
MESENTDEQMKQAKSDLDYSRIFVSPLNGAPYIPNLFSAVVTPSTEQYFEYIRDAAREFNRTELTQFDLTALPVSLEHQDRKTTIGRVLLTRVNNDGSMVMLGELYNTMWGLHAQRMYKKVYFDVSLKHVYRLHTTGESGNEYLVKKAVEVSVCRQGARPGTHIFSMESSEDKLVYHPDLTGPPDHPDFKETANFYLPEEVMVSAINEYERCISEGIPVPRSSVIVCKWEGGTRTDCTGVKHDIWDLLSAQEHGIVQASMAVSQGADGTSTGPVAATPAEVSGTPIQVDSKLKNESITLSSPGKGIIEPVATATAITSTTSHAKPPQRSIEVNMADTQETSPDKQQVDAGQDTAMAEDDASQATPMQTDDAGDKSGEKVVEAYAKVMKQFESAVSERDEEIKSMRAQMEEMKRQSEEAARSATNSNAEKITHLKETLKEYSARLGVSPEQTEKLQQSLNHSEDARRVLEVAVAASKKTEKKMQKKIDSIDNQQLHDQLNAVSTNFRPPSSLKKIATFQPTSPAQKDTRKISEMDSISGVFANSAKKPQANGKQQQQQQPQPVMPQGVPLMVYYKPGMTMRDFAPIYKKFQASRQTPANCRDNISYENGVAVFNPAAVAPGSIVRCSSSILQKEAAGKYDREVAVESTGYYSDVHMGLQDFNPALLIKIARYDTNGLQNKLRERMEKLGYGQHV